jgi:hypothetical protein
MNNEKRGTRKYVPIFKTPHSDKSQEGCTSYTNIYFCIFIGNVYVISK